MTAPMSSDGGISVPARLILYEGLKVDKLDQYVVTAPGGLIESNVLLVNESMELCGIFNLVKDDSTSGTFYLTTGSGSTWKDLETDSTVFSFSVSAIPSICIRPITLTGLFLRFIFNILKFHWPIWIFGSLNRQKLC